MSSLTPSRSMNGLRSIHAPEPQNAPALSALNDCATSGALPPRLAAMILSSLMPPTTLTVTPGFFASKPLTASLNTRSSRWVKPTQSVISAGSSLAAFAAGFGSPDDFFESSPVPPHAPTSSARTSATPTIADRSIPLSSPSLVKDLS